MTSTCTSRRTVRAFALIGVILGSLLFLSSSRRAQAQTPPQPPAPSSVGTNIPQSYQGVPASGIDRELVGPVQLLRSGTMDFSDPNAPTITIPLYLGHLGDAKGQSVWYILTDTDDEANAAQLGLNFSSKLSYSAVGTAFRNGTLESDGSLTFDKGKVDFSPVRTIVPGDAPNFFPPKVASPGAVGDADYTPLVRIVNSGNHMYDAPMVAFGVDASQIMFCDGNPDYSLVADRVAKICPDGNGGGTVTIKLTPVISFSRPALYMSMDSNDPMAAAMDGGTYAPAMGSLVVGRDDGAFSALERIFPITNGPTGIDNPQRQGFNSALGDGPQPDGADLPPLTLIGAIPTIALDYSPMWDLNLGEWTQAAIDKGYRARVTDEFQFLTLVQQGWITGPGGKPFGSTGIILNCPIVFRYE